MPEQRRVSRGPGRWTIPSVLLAIWVAVPGVPAGDTGPDGATSLPRVHADPHEVTRALLDALDALLAEDPVRAKRALDRVAAASPPVMPEAKEHLGKTVVGADAAFHNLLDLTREVANRGNNALAMARHQGLQRTCLDCHAFARKDGVFRTSSRGGSGSPIPPSVSTPSR